MRRLLSILIISLIAPFVLAFEFYNIEGYVRPERIYVGQQFEICVDVAASHNATIEVPYPSGIPSTIKIGKSRSVGVSTRKREDGTQEFVHTVVFSAIASRPAAYDLGELDIAIRTTQRVSSFFGTSTRTIERRLPILWKPFEIVSLPLEGKPEDFSNAVGQFLIKTEVEPLTLSVGDIAKITVSLQGKGSLNGATISMPRLDEKLFKVYPSEEAPVARGELQRITANIIPLSTQSVDIAYASFTYFDPRIESYQVAQSPPLKLTFCEKEESNIPAVRRLDIGSSSVEETGDSTDSLQLYLAPSEMSLRTYRISANARLRVLETSQDGEWKRVLVIDSQKTGWLR